MGYREKDESHLWVLSLTLSNVPQGGITGDTGQEGLVYDERPQVNAGLSIGLLKHVV
jgi:hypothetical protein